MYIYVCYIIFQFVQLQSSCIELLEIMLEEIDENSPVLANRTKSHLKMSSLHQVMQQLWSPSVSPCMATISTVYCFIINTG